MPMMYLDGAIPLTPDSMSMILRSTREHLVKWVSSSIGAIFMHPYLDNMMLVRDALC